MPTERVYRMETPSGRGVFTTGAVWDYAVEASYNLGPQNYHHPADGPEPERDGIKHHDDTDVCGFESIEQMLEWFRHPQFFHILDEHDIKITIFEIETERVRRGRHQVMFPRHLARMVESSKPSDFASNLKICA